MALRVSVDGDAISLHSGRGGEKKRISLDDVEGVEIGAPHIGLRYFGSGIPGMVRGIFRSDVGTVYCRYGSTKSAITFHMREGYKYAAMVYGVDDPVAAHAAISDALSSLGRGPAGHLVRHKTEEEKLLEAIEQSKYEQEWR